MKPILVNTSLPWEQRLDLMFGALIARKPWKGFIPEIAKLSQALGEGKSLGAAMSLRCGLRALPNLFVPEGRLSRRRPAAGWFSELWD